MSVSRVELVSVSVRSSVTHSSKTLLVGCVECRNLPQFVSPSCHFPEGWVVCEEFVDTLKSAWDEAQSAKAEKQREKKSKRALDNWKLLVR